MYELRDSKALSLQEDLTVVAREICGEQLTKFEIANFDIPSAIQSELKLIAIELLRNAKAHSRASQIELTLRAIENRTYLEVRITELGVPKWICLVWV
jgi:signal transduction histidine kinase